LFLIMSVDALMDCDLLYNIFHPSFTTTTPLPI
jgi:hypothetical protein